MKYVNLIEAKKAIYNNNNAQMRGQEIWAIGQDAIPLAVAIERKTPTTLPKEFIMIPVIAHPKLETYAKQFKSRNKHDKERDLVPYSTIAKDKQWGVVFPVFGFYIRKGYFVFQSEQDATSPRIRAKIFLHKILTGSV